jgi:hypothetical protein
MEATHFSERSVDFQQTTWCYISEDRTQFFFIIKTFCMFLVDLRSEILNALYSGIEFTITQVKFCCFKFICGGLTVCLSLQILYAHLFRNHNYKGVCTLKSVP